MKISWFGIAVILGLLSGCTDAGRGIVFDDQGGGPDSPERATARTERLLDQDLRAAGIIATTIRLTNLPVWAHRYRRADAQWIFTSADLELGVSVADRAAAEDIVRRSLRPWLAERVNPQISFVPVISAAPETATVPEIASSGIPYVIQPGDTVGQLSVVFYGSAQHWRRIADANPDLYAEGGPTVGATIIIPPLVVPAAVVSPAP